MLADAKAQNMVADFVEDWLDINTIALRPEGSGDLPACGTPIW